MILERNMTLQSQLNEDNRGNAVRPPDPLRTRIQ